MRSPINRVHIHNNAPQAHPQQEAYDDDNENNNNKDYCDNYGIAISNSKL